MRSVLLISAAIALLSSSAQAFDLQQPVRPSADGRAIHGEERQPLFRHATFPEAWNAAQANRRPVLLYVTSDNCLYCKKMLRQTLAHPQIRQVIAEHAEPFAFNATESPELAQKLGIRGYPTTLVISPDRELLCQIEGFVEPQEFAERVWPVFEKSAEARQAVHDRSGETADPVYRN